MTNMFLNDSDDLFDIRRDRIFKAVFTHDTPDSRGALSKLISALICRNVTIINLTVNEPPVDRLGERHIRFDINCIVENGEPVNIEISLNPKPFEPVKLEYYSGKLFTGQDIQRSEKTYDDLKQSYQIAILAEKQFFPDQVFLHNFEYYDHINQMPLNGRSRIITVELSKLDQVIEKPVKETNSQERWAVFFEYLTNKGKRGKINEIIAQEEGIAMALKILHTISKDQAERWRQISEEKYELDKRSELAYERQIAKQEGKLEGRQEIIDLLKSGKSLEEIIKEYGAQ